MSAIRKFAGFVRRRLEGLVFLLVALLLLPALIAHVVWHGAVRSELMALLSRWVQIIAHGLREIRQAWWDGLQFETSRDIWWNVIAIEVAAVMNLSRKGIASRWSGELPRNARILVIKLAHIGDTLHILPMMEALRAQRPEARIDLLVGPWTEKLVSMFALQDETVVYAPHFGQFERGNRRSRRGLVAEVKFLLNLRHRKYDLIISTSSTQIVELMLMTCANPTLWIGATAPVSVWDHSSHSRTVSYDSRCYEAKRVSRLLDLAGLQPGGYHLRFPLTRKAHDELRALLPAAVVGRPLVVIAPGAGWSGKLWPAGRFAEIADWLEQELGFATVLVGSKDEQSLVGQIAAQVRSSAVNLAGRTDLEQLAALMESAGLFIGNDSSPLHFATAFDLPSVALFGPTVASKWAPPSDRVAVVQHWQCEGCLGWHHESACLHENRCMKAISVEEVKNAVRGLLARLRTGGAALPDGQEIKHG